jgi:short-subunit dehydrogenase
VLINNAGYGKFSKLEDSTTEDFDGMFAVNVRGLYLCSRYFVKSMISSKGGTIINISSISGKTVIPTASIYAATKHAVMALSQALMLEVRQHGIRVSVICPGSVDTDFFDSPGTVLTSNRESILAPEDVAEACLLVVKLPARALMNEVEIRPANPQKM